MYSARADRNQGRFIQLGAVEIRVIDSPQCIKLTVFSLITHMLDFSGHFVFYARTRRITIPVLDRGTSLTLHASVAECITPDLLRQIILPESQRYVERKSSQVTRMQIRDGPPQPVGTAAAAGKPCAAAPVRREPLAPRSANTGPRPYVSPPAAARSLSASFR
jgi:hypothetical protein